MTRPSALRIATALALLGGASCGGARDGHPHAPDPSGDRWTATVKVQNQHWSDVRVFAVSGATKHRLGIVASMTTSRLELPERVLALDGELRLLLDPVGGGPEHLTRVLTVWPGGLVDLQVRAQIELTVATIR